ncbi:hypothetical protein NBRC110019_04140 [Neptunitalea chrysea]|uniref:VWA domain-containing protein n=1 Tax=Neptunitalea chrysea TaxID=1647581 RepID=A0A9W6B4C9_9FLAO|nr:hypothetical protein NBRC110019_04140 [Neptunitalea chrysea]
MVDGSSSITKITDTTQLKDVINNFIQDKDLKNKYDIQTYRFSKDVQTENNTFSFKGDITDISNAITTVDGMYSDSTAPIVLCTDGNQTYGLDYEYIANKIQHPIYSLVVGDTIQYEDIRIAKINVNNYAFYDNEFPVEIFLKYKGNSDKDLTFKIKSGSNTVYSEAISFSPENSSSKVEVLLKANKFGVLRYMASISELNDEKNTANNKGNFAVEVLDQKTKIALVSDIIHPDLGALKKSIESNEQRTVVIGSPSEFIDKLNDFQLVILYQPVESFKNLYKQINSFQKNTFIVTGSKTDWDFLNKIQNDVFKDISNQEEITPAYNSGFTTFILNDIPFEKFPPLKGYLGNVTFKGNYDILLQQKVRNITLEDPLLVTIENNNRRCAVLFGENSWRWRAKTFLEAGNFKEYDQLINKLVFYLASNKKKERLQVEAKNFYYGTVLIDAAYFNKNYELDTNASLSIKLKNKESGEAQEYQMQFKNSYFEFTNNTITPGTYDYTVLAANGDFKKSGTFTLIPFSVEDQFYNANYNKLAKLANTTNGKTFLLQNVDALKRELIATELYKPVQKSSEKISPLVSWKLLLFVLAFLLGIEWFLRKYFGHI